MQERGSEVEDCDGDSASLSSIDSVTVSSCGDSDGTSSESFEESRNREEHVSERVRRSGDIETRRATVPMPGNYVELQRSFAFSFPSYDVSIERI